MTLDSRIVYGAQCSWWDTVDKAGQLPSGLPCCPYCHGVLYEMTAAEWRASIHRYVEGQPDYVEFITWARGRCLPSYHVALAEYRAK
jgi:hypothetical protein